jgi:hypothetical protein
MERFAIYIGMKVSTLVMHMEVVHPNQINHSITSDC